MQRPCCRDCLDFIPTEEGIGECHGTLPTIGLIVRSILVREGQEEAEKVRKTAWGQFPTLKASTPCCPRHQGYEGWKANPDPPASVSDRYDDLPF
jgi:hypothetical protein